VVGGALSSDRLSRRRLWWKNGGYIFVLNWIAIILVVCLINSNYIDKIH
jgi:hypothetical protein